MHFNFFSKTKLCQRFKKENQSYDNIYNFRLRSVTTLKKPGEIVKDEEILLSSLMIEQNNENIIFVELDKPPLNGLVKVKVNLIQNFPPATASTRIL